MRTIRILLALVLATAAGRADSRIYGILNFTNSPVQSNTVIINGDSRTWLTNVSFPTNQIVITNSIGGNKTNLYTHIIAYPVTNNVELQMTSSNALVFVAQPNKPLTISISGTYATITYKTNTVYAAEPVVMAFTVEPTSSRSNIASGLVTAIDVSATNQFSQTSYSLQGYTSLGQTQTLGNKTITNSSLNGALVTNAQAWVSNSYWQGGVITNASIQGGNVSNITAQRLTITSGTLTGATAVFEAAPSTVIISSTGALSSAIYIPTLSIVRKYGATNVPAGVGAGAVGFYASDGVSLRKLGDLGFITLADATNGNSPAYFTLSTTPTNSNTPVIRMYLDETGLTVSNRLTVPGTLTVGTGTVAVATIQSGTVTGSVFATSLAASSATLTNATIFAAALTATNGTNLGGFTSNTLVTSFVSSNGIIGGTNVLVGDLSTPFVTLSSASTTNVLAAATNVAVRITGSPGGAWVLAGITGGRDGLEFEVYNKTGFTLTIAHEAGTAPNAATRIRTMTGSDVATGTNSYSCFKYDATDARWLLKSHNP